jgi:hypothetical protein
MSKAPPRHIRPRARPNVAWVISPAVPDDLINSPMAFGSKTSVRSTEHARCSRGAVRQSGRYVIELPSSAPFAVGMGKKWLATKVEQSIDTMLDRIETHWEL